MCLPRRTIFSLCLLRQTIFWWNNFQIRLQSMDFSRFLNKLAFTLNSEPSWGSNMAKSCFYIDKIAITYICSNTATRCNICSKANRKKEKQIALWAIREFHSTHSSWRTKKWMNEWVTKCCYFFLSIYLFHTKYLYMEYRPTHSFYSISNNMQNILHHYFLFFAISFFLSPNLFFFFFSLFNCSHIHIDDLCFASRTHI